LPIAYVLYGKIVHDEGYEAFACIMASIAEANMAAESKIEYNLNNALNHIQTPRPD
jgi:hypothetical protein